MKIIIGRQVAQVLKKIRHCPAVLILIFLFLTTTLMPAGQSSAVPIIANYNVDTSVAFGTAYGDIFADLDSVAAGTDLSAELADIIENDPSSDIPGVFGGDPRLTPALSNNYGTLDNLTFLTSDLTQFGNAGVQLEDAFEAHFTSLNALIGGVGTWSITNTS